MQNNSSVYVCKIRFKRADVTYDKVNAEEIEINLNIREDIKHPDDTYKHIKLPLQRDTE
jgi:hypothetical protein